MTRRLAVIVGVILLTSGLNVVPSAVAQVHVPATVSRDLGVEFPAGLRGDRRIVLPFRANMIGVSYQGQQVGMSIRAHDIVQGWSGWMPVVPSENETDLVIERDAARFVSNPLWVGTADQVTIRLDGGTVPPDVRIALINTLGDAKSAGLLRRIGSTIAGVFSAAPHVGASQAEASPGQPSIVSRSDWGADESLRTCCLRYAPAVEVAFVHHSATSNDYAASEAPAIVRAIYTYHTKHNGWSDIGYNFLVDRYGTVYEGRYGGITEPVIGAHAHGFNAGSTGVALIGTFGTEAPPAAMVSALERLLAWKLDTHHIPAIGLVPMTAGATDRFREGQQVTLQRISGHRDVNYTDCPGNRLYQMLVDIRSAANSIGLPKLYVLVSPHVLRADGDGANETVVVKAWFSPSQSWQITFADSSGNALRAFEGTGTYGEATWGGVGSNGAPAGAGMGKITVAGKDSAGRYSRSASALLYIVKTHPAGTVLSLGSELYEVDPAGLRSVPTSAAAASWFASDRAITTGPAELTRYPRADPLGYRDGTVLRTPDDSYHFISGGTRRAFASAAVFGELGYTSAAALAATTEEVEALPQGPTIDSAATHPEGAVVADGSNVAWVISGGERHKVRTLALRRSWYRDAEVVNATTADMLLPEGGPVTWRSGTLLETPDGHFFIASGGTRKVFPDAAYMTAMGYNPSLAVAVPWAELYLPYGGVVDPPAPAAVAWHLSLDGKGVVANATTLDIMKRGVTVLKADGYYAGWWRLSRDGQGVLANARDLNIMLRAIGVLRSSGYE